MSAPCLSRVEVVPSVKSCGCGRSYDPEEWKGLAKCGVVKDPLGDLEMRNCACGSTLAIEMCAVDGCPWHASWTVEETLASYCPRHADEWLLAEENSK